MFITVEKLKKANACGKGFLYFRRKYPNGISFVDMVKAEEGKIEEDFLHWGYTSLNPDDEDIAIYEQLLNIKNSSYYHKSRDLENCVSIVDSSFIKNSEQVSNSKEVSNSKSITGCEYVEDSINVSLSNFITRSNSIIRSDNIENSVEVAKSSYVVHCNGIFECKNVVDCRDLRYCDSLSNSYFCAECSNGKNLLFCCGIHDQDNLVFNKPVSEAQIERIKQQYDKFAQGYMKFIEEWDSSIDNVPRIIYNYKLHYQSFGDTFWKWIQTLPHYDSQLAYSICFKDSLLR